MPKNLRKRPRPATFQVPQVYIVRKNAHEREFFFQISTECISRIGACIEQRRDGVETSDDQRDPEANMENLQAGDANTTLQGRRPTSPTSPSPTSQPSPGRPTGVQLHPPRHVEEITMAEERDDVQQHKQITPKGNFDMVNFGRWQIKTWSVEMLQFGSG